MGGEVPWKQTTPKTRGCLKSAPSRASPRHRLWAGPWVQYSSSWRHTDSTQPLLPCFRYDSFKLTIFRKKKRCSWAPCSNFSDSPNLRPGTGEGEGVVGRTRVVGRTSNVAERLLEAFPPTRSWPQPASGWLLSSLSEYSAPQRRGADSPGYSISQSVEETASMGRAVGMEQLSPRRGCPANAPCPRSGGDNSSRGYERLGSRFEAWKEAANSDTTSWMLFSKDSWHDWISHVSVPGHALKMELKWGLRLPSVFIPCLFF